MFIQCCIFLDDPQTVAEILKKLSKGELVSLGNKLTVHEFYNRSTVTLCRLIRKLYNIVIWEVRLVGQKFRGFYILN